MSAIPLRLLATLLSGLSLTGCLTAEQVHTNPATEITELRPLDHYIPVQRYGRYTLVELAPEAAQQNLLLQVIDMDLPGAWSVSVSDALRYVLLRSGYQLCGPTPDNASLFALPLPAAHLKLGPMTLRDALLTLAGPAWSLQADDQRRLVCFIPAANHVANSSSAHEAIRSETVQ